MGATQVGSIPAARWRANGKIWVALGARRCAVGPRLARMWGEVGERVALPRARTLWRATVHVPHLDVNIVRERRRVAVEPMAEEAARVEPLDDRIRLRRRGLATRR